MYGVIEVGKYNVSYEGFIYDGKIPYKMVIIQEFEGYVPVGKSKTLYFRVQVGKYIVPIIKTEKEVEELLKYKNNQKLQVYKKLAIERV